jgi:putative PIN family toxin of toxin-antitoxin system
MIDEEYFVPDTNVLISRSLTRSSPAAVAVHLALDRYQMLISDETFQELESVLLRAKFDRYSTIAERLGFLALVKATARRIEFISPVLACRDPKDDKFLARALSGRASVILTGDDDLLALHPFRGIDILNPRQFLDLHSGARP